jgi:hypothetical protein
MPLSWKGNGQYKSATINRFSDTLIDGEWIQAPSNAIILIEGVFMLRDGLERLWDLSIYLDTTTEQFWSRFLQWEQKAGVLKSPEAVKMSICIANRVYELENQPKTKASIVINQDDIRSPKFSLQRIEPSEVNPCIGYLEALTQVIHQAGIEARRAVEVKELDIDIQDQDTDRTSERFNC